MNTNLVRFWLPIKESMWFIPTIMTILAIFLAYGLVELDRSSIETPDLKWFFYGGNAEGARSILSTIAASMITIAGVAFSINLVTLTLASSQYGPRILRNFIKDRGNQVVLGTFIATFIYSIMVLLSIRGAEEQKGFVPTVAVAFAFVLSLASLGVLIYFINHTSSSIQADSIIKSAYKELDLAIKKYFPSETKNQSEADIQKTIDSLTSDNYKKTSIVNNRTGYIQAINNGGLLKICCKKDVILKLNYQVGDFVIEGEKIAEVFSRNGCGEEIEKDVLKSIVVGVFRTPEQEIEFSINQLTEIAIRALSPGVNDPHTAITCIHWLGAALVEFSQLKLPAHLQYDEKENLRIIRKVHDFKRMIDVCFETIRYHSAGNVYVSIYIIKALKKVIIQTSKQEYRDALIEMTHVVVRSNESKTDEPKELHLLKQELQELLAAAENNGKKEI